MLLGADQILKIIHNYRLVWIAGRFSGGKTSLAMRLAQEFLEHEYRLITNNKNVWNDDLETIEFINGMLKSVVIIDEGGIHVKASKQVEQMAAFAAKMDCVYLFPSFFPPVRAAQVVVIQPLFNFKQIGLPLVIYQWRVKLVGFEDKGSFAWLFPQEIYGIYSRQDPGLEPEEIIAFMVDKTQAFIQSHTGRTSHSLSGLEEGLSEADLLRDAVETFAQAADSLSSLPVGSAKRGRRQR